MSTRTNKRRKVGYVRLQVVFGGRGCDIKRFVNNLDKYKEVNIEFFRIAR